MYNVKIFSFCILFFVVASVFNTKHKVLNSIHKNTDINHNVKASGFLKQASSN